MLLSLKNGVNYYLETYVTNDGIAKTMMEIQNFKMLSSMTSKLYAETLWKIAFRCNEVHTK